MTLQKSIFLNKVLNFVILCYYYCDDNMKKLIKYMDKKLLIATIILFVFGLIMIFSASNVTAYMFGASPSRYFYKQSLFLFGSFIGCTIMMFIPTSKYKKLSWVALIGVTFLVFVALVYGTVVNDASGWIGIGGLGIQPSEFAKVVIIMWLACYYETTRDEEFYNDTAKMFFPLFVIGIITFLIILQNDYGTALIFLLISMFIFLLSPTSKKIKLLVVGTGTFLVITIVVLCLTGVISFLSSDKLARFNFFDPCSRYLNEGNQVCNGYIAINGGGIFGKGLGNSTQKYLYLPEGHTDFIFAIIVEELGIVGAILLMLLYMFVLIRIILIGKKASKNYQALICYGVFFYLFSHIVINLGGVLGLMPLTGIPLPFMSYGGSFALSTCIALTMVQRICFEINQQKN